MNVSLTFPPRIACCPALPASKSLSARALIINALARQQGHIGNLARCDDTDALRHALASRDAHINVGAAGTAMRFLTAFFAANEGRELTLDGSPRMRQRPIGVLVEALHRLGADISYLNAEGFPPLLIKGRRLAATAQPLKIDASVSSQYISALLMIAPAVAGGLTLELTGEAASEPYIAMTIGLMRLYGATVSRQGATISVAEGEYTAADIEIEADWSAASYWLAMKELLPGSEIDLQGLRADSLQGDSRIVEHLKAMAARPDVLRLDFSDTPDVAQTMVVAACVAGQPFRFTGLRTLRIKETDRLAALQCELRKLGYPLAIEHDSVISWDGTQYNALPHPVIATYADHRMAMAMALAAISRPGLVIADAQVVTKSYPDFWQQLQRASITVAFA